MFKIIRVLTACLFFSALCLYFLDFSRFLPDSLSTLARLQLIPAMLAANVTALAVLAVLALLGGRIYCSVICPLGVLQDMLGRLSRLRGRKKHKLRYTEEKKVLRWTVAGLVFLSALTGYSLLLSLLDPYSLFGRITANLFRPLYLALNNGLAFLFSQFDNYALYKMKLSLESASSLVVALVSLGLVGFLSWKYGRLYCNAVCPVGSLLGLLSRFAVFKIRMDTAACTGCGRCEAVCKASCLDSRNRTVDSGRCVVCLNCLEACASRALSFNLSRPGRKKREKIWNREAGGSRRVFTLGLLGLGLAAISIKLPPTALAATGNADVAAAGSTDVPIARSIPVSPPGAGGTDRFNSRCTACQLCVSKCPSQVLRPAFLDYGLQGFMQPVLDFRKGFCNYNCALCTVICPNKALRPLSVQDKQRTQIGKVVFNKKLCVVHTLNKHCGACAEHCPTQAVSMGPYKNALTIPVINQDICIGCGACEFICPTLPYRAIYVQGNKLHQRRLEIESPREEDRTIDSFGF